jgi:hypothetical protein
MGQARWANGITDLCEGASITSNQLVDLSDRAITIEGERYRIQPPVVPLTAVAATGNTALGKDNYGVSYSYNYTSPLTVESGLAAGARVDTTAAGQQIDVSALSGIPANVASVNFYFGSFFVPMLRERTVAVSNGATPAFTLTALPPSTAPAPPTFDKGSRAATQHSQVSGNTIVSAGNSAFAALSADPIGECASPFMSSTFGQSFVPTTCLDLPDEKPVPGSSPPSNALDPRDFTGSSVTGNTFWTGSRTDFFVGLMIGSLSVWGTSAPIGTGASFTSNTVGVTPTRVNMAIDTDGMLNVNLTGNTEDAASYTLVDGNPGIQDDKCPQQVWGYNGFTATFVSGSDVPPVTSNSWLDCMAPSPVAMDQIAAGTGSANLTFVGSTTGVRFSPFGTNYATGNEAPPGTGGGILAVPYATLVRDFRTIRHAGFNTIRFFIEFSDFIDPPSSGFPDGTPNTATLATLQQYIALAARDGLRVDLTGLFESDPAHTPAWYDALTADGGETHGRWQAQQEFWSAVAGQLEGDTNVLDYDLMNEPFVSAKGDGTPWSSGCIGGTSTSPAVCYTQAVTLNPNGRSSDSIVHSWIQALTSAIRGTGDTHLITVGQLPLSGGGFEATNTAPVLSYVSVHEYPSQGAANITSALANVRGFQAGKPLVIEEWYPLNDHDGNELAGFIASSAQSANGSATGWSGRWPGCGFLALNNPPGSCPGDGFADGSVFSETVISVTLSERLPRGFPEV